jgi:hypothetical protein
MFAHYLQLMITLRNVTMCLLFGLTMFFMESSLALGANMSFVITQIGTPLTPHATPNTLECLNAMLVHP